MNAPRIDGASTNHARSLPPGVQRDPLGAVALPAPNACLPRTMDALGAMMSLSQEMSSLGLHDSLSDIQSTRAKQREAHEALMRKLDELAAKAKASEKDSGWGWLGFVGEAFETCLSVVARLQETTVDMVRAPLDVAVGLCQGGNLKQLLDKELSDLQTTGKFSKTTVEAVRGVVRFVADTMEAGFEFGKAMADGKPLGEALKTLGRGIWEAASNNLLENESFMNVVQLAGFALSTLTGGLAAPLVLGAVYLESKLQLLDKVAPESALPWVRMGVALATIVFVGTSGDEASVFKGLEDVARAVNITASGLSALGGLRHIELAQKERAVDRVNIDIAALLQKQALLERVLSDLLRSTEERVDDRSRTHQTLANAAQLSGSAMEASAMLTA